MIIKRLLIAVIIISMIFSCRGPLSRKHFPDQVETSQGLAPLKSQASHSADVRLTKENVKVDPCQGCITIAHLYSAKSSYSGKTVKITGKIIKINPAIMGKNWLHIQDGTDSGGFYDLTVTTEQQLKVGETVTLEGEVSLDRDFGYGYTYEILIENGRIVR